jgi:tetratricopeptide (TPR) repeat protein
VRVNSPRRAGASSTAAWAGVALALALAACAPKGIDEARSALRTNDLPTARALLEADRERFPNSVPVRLALGEVYYRSARDALDWDGDEARYLAYLEKAVDEFVRAAALEPKNPSPLFYLAMIDMYRGDLAAAQRGLRNVNRLGFGPIGDTNLAESYIYAGDLAAAAHWNEMGRIGGAGFGPVTFNEMLIRWSRGDLDGARRAFELLRVQYPELVRTINVAPLPTAPRHFEEFAGYCCASPACGPYLEHACAALALPVKHRAISEETVLRELRLEMEKQRRLREIYRQRKELELEIEGEDEGEGDAPPR